MALAGNLRLAVGLVLAWVLSAATLFATIRRLPAMAVLLRRRMRRPAPRGAASPARSDPASLLRQNDALPGNRVDGFRYHHLRLMIVLTPLYLWLELSFGVSLLDKMGSSLPIDETEAVEHWGRLISGLALALRFPQDLAAAVREVGPRLAGARARGGGDRGALHCAHVAGAGRRDRVPRHAREVGDRAGPHGARVRARGRRAPGAHLAHALHGQPASRRARDARRPRRALRGRAPCCSPTSVPSCRP